MRREAWPAGGFADVEGGGVAVGRPVRGRLDPEAQVLVELRPSGVAVLAADHEQPSALAGGSGVGELQMHRHLAGGLVVVLAHDAVGDRDPGVARLPAAAGRVGVAAQGVAAVQGRLAVGVVGDLLDLAAGQDVVVGERGGGDDAFVVGGVPGHVGVVQPAVDECVVDPAVEHQRPALARPGRVVARGAAAVELGAAVGDVVALGADVAAFERRLAGHRAPGTAEPAVRDDGVGVAAGGVGVEHYAVVRRGLRHVDAAGDVGADRGQQRLGRGLEPDPAQIDRRADPAVLGVDPRQAHVERLERGLGHGRHVRQLVGVDRVRRHLDDRLVRPGTHKPCQLREPEPESIRGVARGADHPELGQREHALGQAADEPAWLRGLGGVEVRPEISGSGREVDHGHAGREVLLPVGGAAVRPRRGRVGPVVGGSGRESGPGVGQAGAVPHHDPAHAGASVTMIQSPTCASGSDDGAVA